jgi:hypothetical protein
MSRSTTNPVKGYHPGLLSPAWDTMVERQAVGIRSDSPKSGVVRGLDGPRSTSQARKTGLDTAMIIEDVRVIAALARRVSGKRTSIPRHGKRGQARKKGSERFLDSESTRKKGSERFLDSESTWKKGSERARKKGSERFLDSESLRQDPETLKILLRRVASRASRWRKRGESCPLRPRSIQPRHQRLTGFRQYTVGSPCTVTTCKST